MKHSSREPDLEDSSAESFHKLTMTSDLTQHEAPEPGLASVPFYLVIVVWGKDFTDLLINVCLPSLLASGNIPALSQRSGSRLLIFTTPEDSETISQSASYKRLASVIPVELRFIDKLDARPHDLMSRCHREAMQLADRSDAAAVFLAPDFIFANNVLEALGRIFQEGKRVVFTPAHRLNSDSFVPAAIEQFRSEDKSLIDVPSRPLCALGLKHLHRSTREFFWRADTGASLNPVGLVWEVAGEGLLAHFFHLHPLLVYSRNKFASFEGTIDNELALAACPDPNDYHVVEDSDEFLIFELSKPSHLIIGLYRKESVIDVCAWALGGANATHRWLARHPLRLHRCDVDSRKWGPVEQEARRVVEKALVEPGVFLRVKLAIFSVLMPHYNSYRWHHVIPGYFRLIRIWQKVFGVWPDVTIFHRHWLWLRSIRAALRSLEIEPGSSVLWLSRDEPADIPLIQAFAEMCAVEILPVPASDVFFSSDNTVEFAAKHHGRFDTVVIDHASSRNELPSEIRIIPQVLKTGGKLCIGCEILNPAAPYLDVQALKAILRPHLDIARQISIGGNGTQMLMTAHRWLAHFVQTLTRIRIIGDFLAGVFFWLCVFSVFPILNVIGFGVEAFTPRLPDRESRSIWVCS